MGEATPAYEPEKHCVRAVREVLAREKRMDMTLERARRSLVA